MTSNGMFNVLMGVIKDILDKVLESDKSIKDIPIFETFNRVDSIAKFECYKNKNNAKKPIREQIIFMSDCFDYPQKKFIEIMVHEMIHYYIAWNRIKDNNAHGKEFMKIANELKEKYDLNITKKVDASSFKLTENAPKIVKKKSLFSFLFG